MAVQAVVGAQICGKRLDGKFVGTGPAKGNYALSICDRPKHSDNRHSDSTTNKEWRA